MVRWHNHRNIERTRLQNQPKMLLKNVILVHQFLIWSRKRRKKRTKITESLNQNWARFSILKTIERLKWNGRHVQKQAHKTIQIYSEGKCVDFETFDWDLRKKFGSYLYFAFVHPFYTIIHFSRSFSALKHCTWNLMNYANIYPIVSKVDDLR